MKKCWHAARSSERGMAENDSESLPFESPEQENISPPRGKCSRCGGCWPYTGLRYPNSRLENPPPTETVETATQWTRKSVPERGSRCFEACFEGERMFTHGDGRVPMAGPDMPRQP